MKVKEKVFLIFVLLVFMVVLPLASGVSNSSEREKTSSTNSPDLNFKILSAIARDGTRAEMAWNSSDILTKSELILEPADLETEEADKNLPKGFYIPEGFKAYKIYIKETTEQSSINKKIKDNFTLKLGYPQPIRPEIEGGLRLFILNKSRWVQLKSRPDIFQKLVKTENAQQFGIYRLMLQEESNSQGIIVYPNPVQFGIKVLKFLNAPEGSKIEVYTITGERLWSSNPVGIEPVIWDGRKENSDEFVPSGMYIYRVQTVGKNSFGKIVVQR